MQPCTSFTEFTKMDTLSAISEAFILGASPPASMRPRVSRKMVLKVRDFATL